MHPRLAQIMGTALDLVFPQRCVGCGREGAVLCPSCIGRLPVIEPPVCPRCGGPQPGGLLCRGCAGIPSSIDGIRAPYRFEGAIRKTIHQLKYESIRSASKILGVLLADFLKATDLPADVVIPVPLHPARLKERGYNQSALIAAYAGKALELPVVEGSLVRVRRTSAQAKTAALEERRKNVQGAFECRDTGMKNKRVLLIDDVTTSGATLDACAAVLKAAGADTVWGAAVAKEI